MMPTHDKSAHFGWHRTLTASMPCSIMHTMSETNRNPVIRVYPHTRQKLKVRAAQRGMTMQDYVEWLVSRDTEENKEAKDAIGRTHDHQEG